MIEPAAFFYLTPEPDWLGRQDKRGASPTLTKKALENAINNLRCRSDIVLVGDVRHPKQENALSLD